MKNTRAFVGHSFTADDREIVGSILKFLDTLVGRIDGFSWVNAQTAEPKQLAEKVLGLIEDCNVFIGICTNKELVAPSANIQNIGLTPWGERGILESKLEWKTSDWIIQEIGLSTGRGMKIILLIEEGCRKPGGLQGDVEYIPFNRASPEKAFPKILEMISEVDVKPVTNRAAASDVEVEPESKPDDSDIDLEPKDDWDRVSFENAYRWAYFEDDEGQAKVIEGEYLRKHTSDREVLEWQSFAALWKVIIGKGDISAIKTLAEANPGDVLTVERFARALSTLGYFENANEQYEKAASLAVDEPEKIRLSGMAATELAKADKRAAIRKLESVATGSMDDSSRIALLKQWFALAKQLEDHRLQIETGECLLELVPEDTNVRFSVAYAYSQMNMSSAALYHYSRIPYSERSEMTWNNLGVEYQNAHLPLKAVDAYERSANEGETLAMSNLAYKLIDAGFAREAGEILSKALGSEDCHENVPAALQRLKEAPDTENAALEEALAKGRKKAEMFRVLGKATVSVPVIEMKTSWVGPNFDLISKLEEGKFTATGSFETTASSLGLLFSGGEPQKKKKMEVSFEGQMIGRRIYGKVNRKQKGGGATPFLADIDTSKDFIMVLSEKGDLIHVVEDPTSASPSIYDLTSKSALPSPQSAST